MVDLGELEGSLFVAVLGWSRRFGVLVGEELVVARRGQFGRCVVLCYCWWFRWLCYLVGVSLLDCDRVWVELMVDGGVLWVRAEFVCDLDVLIGDRPASYVSRCFDLSDPGVFGELEGFVRGVMFPGGGYG